MTTSEGAMTTAEPSFTDSRDRAEPREAFGRFRRRLDRIRALPDVGAEASVSDDEAGLQLELMLLREENARLRSACHRPSDLGSAIDRVRLLSPAEADGGRFDDDDDRGTRLDDAWAALGECMAIREGLDQVCAELQDAIDAVRDRLAGLVLDPGSAPAARASVSA